VNNHVRQIRELMITNPALSQVAIGRRIGISGPAVNQAINRNPELRELRTSRSATETQRLIAYRSQLQNVLLEVRRLAVRINRSIRTLDEELQSIEVDHLNGLR
jgi:hypothetical protein